LCIPKGQEEALVEPCKKFMATLRHFTVDAAQSGQLTLRERRRILATEPVEGCVPDEDSEECDLYWQEELGLKSGQHPVLRGDLAANNAFKPDWACEVDDSHSSGPHCVMKCLNDEQCEPGYVCDQENSPAGRCVAGKAPAPECVAALQAFTVRGGESLIVRGSFSGYLHNVVAMGGTCQLLTSPGPGFHPRNVGRIRLRGNNDCPAMPAEYPAVCVDTEFRQTERRNTWDPNDTTCATPSNTIVTDTTARSNVRFENRAMAFHLVDLVTPGDKTCIGDRLGASKTPMPLRPFSVMLPGFSVTLALSGGFAPMAVGDESSEVKFDARFPVTIENGPLGLLWVLDEAETSQSNGAVYHLDPNDPDNGFAVGRIQ
jgi:hypothetical protein